MSTLYVLSLCCQISLYWLLRCRWLPYETREMCWPRHCAVCAFCRSFACYEWTAAEAPGNCWDLQYTHTARYPHTWCDVRQQTIPSRSTSMSTSCWFKSCQACSNKPMGSAISTHTHAFLKNAMVCDTQTCKVHTQAQSDIGVWWSLISVLPCVCAFPGWCVRSGADYSVVHRLPVIDPGFLPGVPGREGWCHCGANIHRGPLPNTSPTGLWHLCRRPLVGTGEKDHSHSELSLNWFEKAF